jgi:hypothetical protein
MRSEELAQNYRGVVRVDLCYACSAIWFDRMESVQLAPAAVIELFKEIHSHLNDPRQPLANRIPCPRCSEVLTIGSDLSKSGTFSYYRCPRGDGRFTPFFQFLREKQFVRSLTAAELQRVRSQVRQIRCSECGAPIDLEHTSQCPFCRAPVSFLDPDAVEKAMHMWSEAESRRRLAPTPDAVGDAIIGMHRARAEPPAAAGLHLGNLLMAGASETAGAGLGLDLIAIGIRAVGRLIRGAD